MTERDYYDILGVSKSATEAEIKQAYRRLAKRYHPDQNKGDAGAEAKFKEVQGAYAVLSDKEKRGKYDQFGHAGLHMGGQPGGGDWRWSTAGGQSFNIDDLDGIFDFGVSGGPRSSGGGSVFEQFFNRRAAGPRATAARPPARDVEQPVSLTFEQAIRGITLDIQVPGGTSERPRRISARIPAGVHEGQRIRLRGQGEPGGGGRPDGDLYVVCSIQPHPFFERRGDDIYLDVPVTITEAALGAKVDLPTLDGVRTVTIPPAAASGSKLRLSGLGVPGPKGKQRGDQYAVIKIVPPARLTDEQRRLLDELAKSDVGSPREGLWQ
ncbi:MAG: DnaJ C-terminal domain-containing protein [Planctomycetota bacterium]